MNRRTVLAVGIAAAIVVAAAGGVAIGRWSASRSAAHPSGKATASAPMQRKVLYWYDPMVPEQHFDRPGLSPMGMEMVPKYADDAPATGVRVSGQARQALGVRTVPVRIGTLPAGLRVPGTLTWNLREERLITLPVQGIVTRLAVRAPYEPVRAGMPLATVLAPEWSAATAEAAALSRARTAEARALSSAARARLRVLGAPGAAASGGFVVTAPVTGVVTEVLVREGQTALPGMPLMRLNGTGSLWLEAAVPQAELARLRPGMSVTATVTGAPGEYSGRIEALLPPQDATTRTARARIAIENRDGRLLPGMLADVRLGDAEARAWPLVPTEAVIDTGDGTRVIVEKDGAFVPVAVTLGRSAGGLTEVRTGLGGGETVVASGQFLIDSEASLSGALRNLEAPAGGAR